MPTACVPLSHCNAKRPGWLDGHHPNVTQGVVNMRVCFTSENDCCGDQKFISVKNCGDFFAYGLELWTILRRINIRCALAAKERKRDGGR
ncbi:unnamed protein product, partial [Pocillopora meandrina]